MTNNVVHDLRNRGRKQEKWCEFLKKNDIHSSYLENLASTYYNSFHCPPIKAFDFYVALVLTEFMEKREFFHRQMKMFYDTKYGLCMIDEDLSSSWRSACDKYYSHIETDIAEGDSPFTSSMKKNFLLEKTFLSGYSNVSSTLVKMVKFNLDTQSRLTISSD